MVSRLPPKGGRKGNQQITFCRDQVPLAPTAEGRRNGRRSRKLQSPVLPVVQVALGRQRKRRQHGCRGRTRIGASPSLSAAGVVVRFKGTWVHRNASSEAFGLLAHKATSNTWSSRPIPRGPLDPGWVGGRQCATDDGQKQRPKSRRAAVSRRSHLCRGRSSRCTGRAVFQPRRRLISLKWKLSRPVYGTGCAMCG